MKKHRALVWIVLILLVLLVFLGIKWYRMKQQEGEQSFIMPHLDIGLLKINKITRETTDMDVQLLIDNPIPAGAKFDSFSYRFFIAGKEVLKSLYPKSIQLNASELSRISMPVRIDNRDLINILDQLERQKADSTDYRMEVRASISFLGFKNRPYEFSITRRFPVFIIPKVTVRDMKLKKLGLKHTQMVMTVEIENPCALLYRFRETSYKLSIDTSRLVSGSIDSAIVIPAFGRTVLDIPADISMSEGVETLFDNWFRSNTTGYALWMETRLISDHDIIKDSKVIIEAGGTLKDLKDLRKK